MSRAPLVLYWQNQASPYMVARFEELTRRGNVRFEALFSTWQAADRDWQLTTEGWGFPHRTLAAATPRARYREVRGILDERQPDLLIAEYDRVSFAAVLLNSRDRATRRATRVLPSFDAWSERNLAREIGKHLVFRSLDAATVSGPEATALAGRYGLPAERTFRITQSIDTAHYGRAAALPAAERRRMRAELGLRGTVFVYTGRLWSGKGIDTLLAAHRRIRAHHDVSLLLLGSGVDEERFRAEAADMPDVVFAGFRQAVDMPQMYALSDCLVLPTLGDPHGLVIEEAMAAGLPAICTTAAGHITERIDTGRTGLLVPPADVRALADALAFIAADPERSAWMGAAAKDSVAGITHTRWTEDFERFVACALAAPARRPLWRSPIPGRQRSTIRQTEGGLG